MTAKTAKITRAIYELVRKNGGEEYLDESAKDTLFVLAGFIADTLYWAEALGNSGRAKQRIGSIKIDAWIASLTYIKTLEEEFESDLAEEKKAAEEAEREAERKEELAALAATKDPEEF